jgi:hypothetical protein
VNQYSVRERLRPVFELITDLLITDYFPATSQRLLCRLLLPEKRLFDAQVAGHELGDTGFERSFADKLAIGLFGER